MQKKQFRTELLFCCIFSENYGEFIISPTNSNLLPIFHSAHYKTGPAPCKPRFAFFLFKCRHKLINDRLTDIINIGAFVKTARTARGEHKHTVFVVLVHGIGTVETVR